MEFGFSLNNVISSFIVLLWLLFLGEIFFIEKMYLLNETAMKTANTDVMRECTYYLNIAINELNAALFIARVIGFYETQLN